jgi:hypothetical protein
MHLVQVNTTSFVSNSNQPVRRYLSIMYENQYNGQVQWQNKGTRILNDDSPKIICGIVFVRKYRIEGSMFIVICVPSFGIVPFTGINIELR